MGDKLFWNEIAALSNVLLHLNRLFGYLRLTQIGSVVFGDIGHLASDLPLIVIPQTGEWNGLDLDLVTDNFSTDSLLDNGTLVVIARVGVSR